MIKTIIFMIGAEMVNAMIYYIVHKSDLKHIGCSILTTTRYIKAPAVHNYRWPII